jgi:Protein of unknown function (DUF1566)
MMKPTERERLEEERRCIEARKTVTNESPSSNSDSSNVVRTSGQYQVTACGSIIDMNTGLEWYVGPDKKTNWNEARSWVNGLSACGGGWRMPGKAELKTLYKKGVGNRNMNPVFKTTGWFVWASETKGSSSAWRLYFDNGSEGWDGLSDSYSRYRRAFAVRSRR